MPSFSTHEHHSLVTAILPRQSASRVLDEVLASGAPEGMAMNARGALLKRRGLQSLLPVPSLEQEVLQFLVPTEDADTLMEQIVMVGKLRRFGAGSIFTVPCEQLVCADDYPLWQPGRYTFRSVAFDIKFKTGLVALTHIADRGNAEPIAQAAIRAGAQGATITYVRGYGLRDRLGLLRITKSHEKELITVVADEYDRDAVFEAMARAGRVDQPGRGLIYQLPIAKGLTNLASVFQAHRHSASIQQMVRAIDELHGSTDWRANQLLVRDPRAKEFAAETRGLSRDVKALNIIARRKDMEPLLGFLLDYGVSGATLSSWRVFTDNQKQTQGGPRMNREVGCIDTIIEPRGLSELGQALQQFMTEHEMAGTCYYISSVPMMKTFASLTG